MRPGSAAGGPAGDAAVVLDSVKERECLSQRGF